MALKKKGRVLFSTCILTLMILLAGVVVFASDSIPEVVEGVLGSTSYGIIVEKQVNVIIGASQEEAQNIKDSKFPIAASTATKNFSEVLVPSGKNYTEPSSSTYKNVFFDTGSSNNITIKEEDAQREGFKLTASYQIEKFHNYAISNGGKPVQFEDLENDTKITLTKKLPENTEKENFRNEVYTYHLIKDGTTVDTKRITDTGTCVFDFQKLGLEAGIYTVEEEAAKGYQFQVKPANGSTTLEGNGNQPVSTYFNIDSSPLTVTIIDPVPDIDYQFKFESDDGTDSGTFTLTSEQPEQTISIKEQDNYTISLLNNAIISNTSLLLHQTYPLVPFDPEKDEIKTDLDNEFAYIKIINNYSRPVSGLKVEKKWDHKDNPESSRPGSVTVQLKQNGKDFHPDPSDPNSGQATLNQQNNWSYIWENLPVGTYDEKNTLQKYTYTIEEITIPNYIVSSSDPNGVELTESANDDKNFPVITLTNTYTKETPKKGSLKITKKLNDAAPDEAKKKEFSFLVTGPSYPESSPKKITITGSGSQLLSDLEPGSYQVKEDTDSAQVENYLLTVTEGGTVEVTVSPGSTAEANITNTYTKEQPVTGSLQVKKAWKDAPAGTNYPEVKIQLYQSGDKYHDPVTLNNRNSWSHIWNNLPIKDESGNYYTYKVVEEKVPDGYSVSYEHNGITLSAQENAPSASPSNASMRTSDTTPGASQPEDTGDTLTATPSNASFQWRKPARSKAVSYSAFSVSKPAASSVPTITVTNTYEGTDDKPITGELSIKKTVTGNRGEQNRQFTFTITLRDEKGEQLPGSYPYDGAKKGTISSGESITLKHGESVTISALPEGTQYQVVEKEADQGGYTTSSSGTTGTIALEKTAEAAFTNHKPGGGNPGGNPPGGGGGGGGKTPKPDPDPTTPPSEVTPPPTEETPTFPETLPNRPTELPDPNSPDSPERFTIWDGDVPKTYVKVWNPETEEFMWIPEEEVPLSGMLPKTGDTSHGVLWIFIAILSLCGIGALLFVKARRRHDTSSSS